MRYIDADALKEQCYKFKNDVSLSAMAFVQGQINAAPTANVAPRAEVAREIFEEIDKRFEALLKFYPCNGEFEDAKKFVDFHWKHIRNSIMCDYDADLKKKYESEGEE